MNQTKQTKPHTHPFFAALQLGAMHTLPAQLCLCAGLAVALVAAFGWQLAGGGSTSFPTLVAAGWLGYLFRLALAGCCLLHLYGGIGKSNPTYLLHRLGAPTTWAGLGWACNTALSLLGLWGVGVVALFGCNLLWQANTAPAYWSQQTFLIDCYRSNFLHAMLPMGDALVWVRNLLSVLAFSLASGRAALLLWQGKQPVLANITLVVLVFWFCAVGISLDKFLIVAYTLVALAEAYGLWQGGTASLEPEDDT